MARNPTSWDDLLSEVLWAYRTSKRMSINTTPYSLVFGHDAVFPMEITVRSMRITRQNELTRLDYQDAMFAERGSYGSFRFYCCTKIKSI